MKTELTLRDPDGIYEQMLDAHDGLTEDRSSALNARLILLLLNQVDDAVAAQCIRAAQAALVQTNSPTTTETS